MDMRATIKLITEAQLDEIERTGYVPANSSMPDDLDQTDLKNDQQDLFPEIPTLEPKVPKGWKAVGRIGAYYVLFKREESYMHYVVVDKSKIVAYVTLAKFSYTNLNYPGSGASPPEMEGQGKGLRVHFANVRPGYEGQGMAAKLYEWVLSNVCDYLMADEAHTPDGEAMWKRFVKMKNKFAVLIWDPDRHENKEITQARWLDRAYKTYANLPWITLRSKVNGLLGYDDVAESVGRTRVSEGFLDSFPSFRGQTCEVFKNPSRTEFRQIKAKNDEVRAFLVDNDILVWNTYSALHQNVREYFRLPNTAIPLMLYGTPGQQAGAMVTDNTKNTPLLHDPEIADAIVEHPYLGKMFDSIEVSYFDEDIVGDWVKIGQADEYDDIMGGWMDFDQENEDDLDEAVTGFHGTSREFKAFRFEKSAAHPSKIGVWFASTSDAASHIARQSRDADASHRVVTADLELGNVMRYDTYRDFLEAFRDAGSAATLRRKLMRSGYNSIEITRSDTDGAGDRTDWAVFEPWQIRGMKSQPLGEDLDEAAGDRLTPFASMSREDFLGNPTITPASNASNLKPRALTTVLSAAREPFLGGRYEAAYSPDGATVFDHDVPVASYNFGDTLVVLPKYRREGIGRELVYQWRTRNPGAKPASHRTKPSHKIQQQVWDRIQGELTEAAGIPYAAYGYLITPTGAYLPIEQGGSHDAAAKAAGLGSDDEALAGGGIRVIHQPGQWIVAQVDSSAVTKRALRAFAAMVRKGRYIDDDHTYPIDDTATGKTYRSASAREMLQVIQMLLERATAR